MTRETEISKIDWKHCGHTGSGVDVVLECTGKFNTIEKSLEHINAGAQFCHACQVARGMCGGGRAYANHRAGQISSAQVFGGGDSGFALLFGKVCVGGSAPDRIAFARMGHHTAQAFGGVQDASDLNERRVIRAQPHELALAFLEDRPDLAEAHRRSLARLARTALGLS